MDEFKRLAIAIKQARLTKGYSQEKFAELLDVSATHVKHMESGHRKPSIDILFSICRHTNLSVDEVLYHSKASESEVDINLKTLINSCTEKEKNIILKISEAVISLKE